MGDTIIIYQGGPNSSSSQALSTTRQPDTAAIEAAAREKRIEDANELEKKLKHIQDTVPTKVYNVMSSTAGAGSGDFHQYRMVRRNEQMRQKKMDEDWEKQQESKEFEEKRAERVTEAEARTSKKRAQRLKKKQAKKSKSKSGATASAAAADGADDSNSGEGSDHDAAAQPGLD